MNGMAGEVCAVLTRLWQCEVLQCEACLYELFEELCTEKTLHIKSLKMMTDDSKYKGKKYGHLKNIKV